MRKESFFQTIPFIYATTSFGATAIHNLFITYYIYLFLTIYQLEDRWFYIGEMIFMVWNSINDPLFGYMMVHSEWGSHLMI